MPFLPQTPIIDIRPILELRARLERRIQRDLSDATNDDTTDLFGRVRAGAAIGYRQYRVQVVYQYAFGVDYNFNTHVSTERSDLVLGNVQGRFGQADLTLGRQRLSYGSERLLGAAEWNNVSDAWDGGRVVWRGAELFATKSGLLATPNKELSLYGGAYTFGPFQALAVFKHDERNEVDEATISAQLRRRFGRVQIDAEAAGQVGHRAGRRKQAGAIDAIATLPVVPKLSFSVQGSVASGGGSGDTTNTFDQLYPSGHDRHGLLDMAGWQNLRDLGLSFRFDPTRATSVKLQFHSLGLDSARDAWYGAGGGPNRRPGGLFLDPTGASGRDLGQEYDLDVSHNLNPHQTVRAGLSLFKPGNFVRSFNGAETRDQLFGYVQFAYRF